MTMKYRRPIHSQFNGLIAYLQAVIIVVVVASTITSTSTALIISTRPSIIRNKTPYSVAYVQLPSNNIYPSTTRRASISPDETSSFTDRQQQQQGQSSSPPTIMSSNNKKSTLYDILGASPDATRSELKQKYVALAKMTHPDAKLRNGNGSDSTTTTATTAAATQYDFNDIATAYKILSDNKQRRRYDRSIQAEILTEQIASAVQNHPITELTIKAIGTFAVPFFRTMNKVATTASTTSTYKPRTTSTSATSDSTTSFQQSRPNTASKYVTVPVRDEQLARPPSNDSDAGFQPPRDKQDLEMEAQQEYNRALQLRQVLQEVTQQRMRMALYTSQSGLNSNEAYTLLNSFPTTTGHNGPSWAERLNFLRSSVEAEIKTLQSNEQSFIQQQQINTRAQTIHQSTIHDQFMIRQNLMNAERAEVEARRALERATEETRQQRYQYERMSEELFAAENAAVHASNELDRMQHIIQKQSENVRLALVRKERVLFNNQNHGKMQEGSEGDDDMDNNNNNMDHKPEPPMSPLFTASSYTSSSKHRSATSASEVPHMMASSESSMLDAWPKQSMSTTTFTQPKYHSNLDDSTMYDPRMGFETRSDDDTGTTTTTGSSSDNGMTTQNHNDMNELMRLRQQEYDLTMTIHDIESHIQHLIQQTIQ